MTDGVLMVRSWAATLRVSPTRRRKDFIVGREREESCDLNSRIASVP
jgi:hypothetical protein